MNPAERARYLEAQRREMYPRLLEAFDHRNDGLAEQHTFKTRLKLYALLGNGSTCQVLADLLKAERQLRQATA